MFTSTSLFPDVNVWLALAHEIHPHHATAELWEQALDPEDQLCFCRITQLGLLRLLTNPSAMGEDVLTQAQAWKTFDGFIKATEAKLLNEPREIEPMFRRRTNRAEVSTKQWADGYLAAFAEAAHLTLVTFDRALAGTVKGAVLLG